MRPVLGTIYVFNDEKIGAFVISIADLLEAIVDKHIATREEVRSSGPELAHASHEQVDLVAMPIALQRDTMVLFVKKHSQRQRRSFRIKKLQQP